LPRFCCTIAAMPAIEKICVFCGSTDSVHPAYLEAAYELGAALARRGLELVYGGGKTGLMGAVARGALEAGGPVTGIIPSYFNIPRLAHTGLTRLEVVETIHQRKARMAELSGAFIALPGGYGTFEELFEILAWAQIGLHSKPVGLLNVRRFYDPLLKFVEHAFGEGFIYNRERVLLSQAAAPEALLDALVGISPTEEG